MDVLVTREWPWVIAMKDCEWAVLSPVVCVLNCCAVDVKEVAGVVCVVRVHSQSLNTHHGGRHNKKTSVSKRVVLRSTNTVHNTLNGNDTTYHPASIPLPLATPIESS